MNYRLLSPPEGSYLNFSTQLSALLDGCLYFKPRAVLGREVMGHFLFTVSSDLNRMKKSVTQGRFLGLNSWREVRTLPTI